MAKAFNVGTLTIGGLEVGVLQNCSLEVNGEVVELPGGKEFPEDLATGPKSITFTAKHGEITSLLQTTGNNDLGLDATETQLVWTVSTGGNNTCVVTLPNVKVASYKIGVDRGQWLYSDITLKAAAPAGGGNVMTVTGNT